MSDWKVPKGYTLTRTEGYVVRADGYKANAGEEPMPDGQIDVAWYDEDEPFYADENNKPGPGHGMKGYSPNVELRPIRDGFVPPHYHMVREDDDTPVTEPATHLAEEPTT